MRKSTSLIAILFASVLMSANANATGCGNEWWQNACPTPPPFQGGGTVNNNTANGGAGGSSSVGNGFANFSPSSKASAEGGDASSKSKSSSNSKSKSSSSSSTAQGQVGIVKNVGPSVVITSKVTYEEAARAPASTGMSAYQCGNVSGASGAVPVFGGSINLASEHTVCEDVFVANNAIDSGDIVSKQLGMDLMRGIVAARLNDFNSRSGNVAGNVYTVRD